MSGTGSRGPKFLVLEEGDDDVATDIRVGRSRRENRRRKELERSRRVMFESDSAVLEVKGRYR